MKFKWKQISGRLSSKSFLWFVSFALALSMWFLVVGNRNEEIAKTFEIPLLISNPPAGLNAYRKVQTVSVTLTGRRRAVNALENQNLTAQIDLKGVPLYKRDLAVTFERCFDQIDENAAESIIKILNEVNPK